MPATANKPKHKTPSAANDRIEAALARPPAVIITEGMLETIPVGMIDVDVITRPLHEAKVISIAESIATVGLQQPITVFYKSNGDRYTLGFGRHRLEAVKRLGKDVIRAFVKPAAGIADIELIQAIENLHRSECTPLEEANYCKIVLIGGPNRSVEDAAALIGWTVKTFQRRLDLLRLSPRLQKLLNDGSMKLGEAQLISRLADPEEQEVVAGMCEFDPVHRSALPLEHLKWEVERRMLSLESVPWRLDLEFAGKVACNACPSNSANAPALFDGDRPKGTLCLNAACYRVKRDVATDQLKYAVKVLVNGMDPSKITLVIIKKQVASDSWKEQVVITPEALLAGVKAKAEKAAAKPTKAEKKGKAIASTHIQLYEVQRQWMQAAEAEAVKLIRETPVRSAGVYLLSGITAEGSITGYDTDRKMKPAAKKLFDECQKFMKRLVVEVADADMLREIAVFVLKHAAPHDYPMMTNFSQQTLLALVDAWALDVPPYPTAESIKAPASKPTKKGGKSK